MTRQLITALVCATAFHAFGTDYAEGVVIPEDVYQEWPEGTVERRLENKYVKWAPIHAPESAEEEASIRDNPELLESMSKAEIKAWAMEEFGEDVAGALDPAKLTKADLLLAVKTLIAEAGEDAA